VPPAPASAVTDLADPHHDQLNPIREPLICYIPTWGIGRGDLDGDPGSVVRGAGDAPLLRSTPTEAGYPARLELVAAARLSYRTEAGRLSAASRGPHPVSHLLRARGTADDPNHAGLRGGGRRAAGSGGSTAHRASRCRPDGPGQPVTAVVDPTTGDPVAGPPPGSSAESSAAPPAARSAVTAVRAYVALTKPRIIELLLVTTFPTMILAAHGLPGWWQVAATLVGGTAAAASANALNCYIDRDIDELMGRTRQRPLARHAVSPRGALVFGTVLGAFAVGWMWLFTNTLAAALSLAAILFYVFVYTLGLKRRTPQNIVWGGAAGCMPVLIGWSAVTGSLAWAPVVLFGVVFCWTPPHFWALAIRYRDDYAAASVPMLPVVAPAATVARQIVAYAWVTVATSLLLWPVAGTGLFYPVVATALGLAFLVEAYGLLSRARRGVDPAGLRAMRLFHGSNLYLALLFLAVAVDPLLH
jgi:heme o synthase